MRSYLQQVLHFLILLLRQFISGHLIVPLLHHTVPGRFGSYGDPIIRILDSRFKAQGTGSLSTAESSTAPPCLLTQAADGTLDLALPEGPSIISTSSNIVVNPTTFLPFGCGWPLTSSSGNLHVL